MSLSSIQLNLMERYQSLEPSDRRALMILGIFLVMSVLAFSLWVDFKASAAEERMLQSKQTLLEMRALGPKLGQSAPDDPQALKNSATQAGISVTLTPGPSGTQIQASSPSMATLSRWAANQISAMAPLSSLSLTQQDNQAVLIATLDSSGP